MNQTLVRFSGGVRWFTGRLKVSQLDEIRGFVGDSVSHRKDRFPSVRLGPALEVEQSNFSDAGSGEPDFRSLMPQVDAIRPKWQIGVRIVGWAKELDAALFQRRANQRAIRPPV